MKKLLHIIASPKAEESLSLRVAREFLKRVKAKYPQAVVDELNLFKTKLPDVTPDQIQAKNTLMGGNELTGASQVAFTEIMKHVERFLSADSYLITAPMWNFSIPYVLKHYIDVIVQPRHLFRYTSAGFEGLVKNRRMYVITGRGGDYSADSPAHSYDLQEPYLRTVFGFVGIADIAFVNAQPLDAGGPEVRERSLAKAIEAVGALNI